MDEQAVLKRWRAIAQSVKEHGIVITARNYRITPFRVRVILQKLAKIDEPSAAIPVRRPPLEWWQ